MLKSTHIAAFGAGMVVAAILAAILDRNTPERIAQERLEMEMLMRIAPIWCGQDGCQ